MIYTVGHEGSYRLGIQKCAPEPLVKTGRTGKPGKRGFYAGGIAFRSVEDAQLWNAQRGRPEWIVWGLDCDWSNTYVYDDGTRRLKADASIIDLAAE